MGADRIGPAGVGGRRGPRTTRDAFWDGAEGGKARQARGGGSSRVGGTAPCRCDADRARRHGPYWQHTRKIGGKTVTRRLTEAQAGLYLQWISNDRRLRALLAELEQVNAAAREKILSQPRDP